MCCRSRSEKAQRKNLQRLARSLLRYGYCLYLVSTTDVLSRAQIGQGGVYFHYFYGTYDFLFSTPFHLLLLCSVY